MKAVIWGRVSTDRQEYETQISELTYKAIADGYAENDLVIIGCAGASAIKQNDLYKQEVEKLLNTLSNDNQVNCVYVWELSRLARNELVFHQMKAFLVERKIQLICITPAIKLLDGDGSVNSGAELTMSLLITLAKQEMEQKAKRFKRAKDTYKAHGKYIGGYVGYGYQVVDGKIAINEEQAKIIRQAFNLYQEGLSTSGVCKELERRGVKLLHTTFSKLLVNRSLTGELVNGKRYPQIISVEQFDKCREIAQGNNRNANKCRNIYFGKDILKCKDCGRAMIGISSSLNVYQCTDSRLTAKTHKMRYTSGIEQCANTGAVSINAVDSVLWQVAKEAEANTMFKVDEQKMNEMKVRIGELQNYINVCDSRIAENQSKIDRAMDMYIEGLMSKEKFNAQKEKYQSAISSVRNEQVNYQSEMERLQNTLNYSKQQIAMSKKFKNRNVYMDELNVINDEQQMYDIVHKHIATATVDDDVIKWQFKSGEKSTKVKVIIVTLMNGNVTEYVYLPKDGKGGRTILRKRYGIDNEPYYEYSFVEYMERFKRKK